MAPTWAVPGLFLFVIKVFREKNTDGFFKGLMIIIEVGVHKKFANFSGMEALTLPSLNVVGAIQSSVNTITLCHDGKYRPSTFLSSGVVHLIRVPKVHGLPQLNT